MVNHYTYKIRWSASDKEFVGLCIEFPSISWLAEDEISALKGIKKLVEDIVNDLKESGEPVPQALCEKKYSGKIMLRIPPFVHQELALNAKEQGVSMNRLISSKLS